MTVKLRWQLDSYVDFVKVCHRPLRLIVREAQECRCFAIWWNCPNRQQQRGVPTYA